MENLKEIIAKVNEGQRALKELCLMQPKNVEWAHIESEPVWRPMFINNTESFNPCDFWQFKIRGDL